MSKLTFHKRKYLAGRFYSALAADLNVVAVPEQRCEEFVLNHVENEQYGDELANRTPEALVALYLSYHPEARRMAEGASHG